MSAYAQEPKGKAASLAANEKTSTPKGALPKAPPKRPRGEATVTALGSDATKEVRRSKPAYPGEKPAGVEPVPAKYPGRRTPTTYRPYYAVKPDTRSGVERAVDRQVTPMLARAPKLASPYLTTPANVAGNVLAQLSGAPTALSAAEHLRHAQVLPAAAELASLLPVGRFGRAAKAAKEALAAEEAAKSSSAVMKVSVSGLKHSHPLDAPHHEANIQAIMDEMRAGVDHPITIDARGMVVDGNQRLEAARRLGRKTISAILDKPPAVPGVSVAARVRGLTQVQQKALQVVREGVPIDKRITQKSAELAALDPADTKAVAAAKKEIGALRAARRHVVDVNGMPRIDPHNHKLIDIYESQAAQTPQEALKEGLKGARSRYGAEKAGQKEEMAARAQAAEHSLNTISDPYEALAVSGGHLRGKYATIDFKGLKELTPETVKALMSHAQNHPTLGVHTKRTVMKALDAAVSEGRVPRPAELRKIEMVFGKKTAAGLVEHARQGLGDKVINVLNIPRSLQATADVSGLLRQNLVAAASHPFIWGRNFPKAFDAAVHPAAFEAYAAGIKDRPLYPMALEAGIQFTDLGEDASLAAHEEPFASDYATHIPGIGHVIKGSARSYVTTGNAMKMDVFENRIRLAQAAGQNVEDPKTLHQIGQVINAATGRGTLPGRAEHLLPAMNTFMFSPRLMLARLHYLDPTWYFRLKGPARREALRGLFATAGGITSALYLFSRIPGVHVGSLDPRSPDFGKLKIHNTRIDIAGGFQQYVRLAAELATQTEVSSTTGKKTKLGSGFGVPTGWDVLTNFGVNKLAPIPGLAVNITRGHDAVGHPLTPGGLLQTYLTPLTFQDAKDIYNEKHGGVDGISWAVGAYGLASFGVGLQTYAPKTPKPRTSSSSGDPYSSGSGYGGGSSYADPGYSAGSAYSQLP